VAGLSPACRGAERRRFLDLGILPGTPVTATLRSPSGDPTAYLIRGALIALRREQAALVRVRELHVASGVST
jgi:DtxR family transcriptional regulator, Mn-dependent transcriptional regulator